MFCLERGLTTTFWVTSGFVCAAFLSAFALRELVSAIYVDAPDKSSGKRVQHIHIKYDGLGFIQRGSKLQGTDDGSI